MTCLSLLKTNYSNKNSVVTPWQLSEHCLRMDQVIKMDQWSYQKNSSFQWIDTKLLPCVLTADQRGQSGLAQIKYKVQMCKNSPNLHCWKISVPTNAVSFFLTISQSPFCAFQTFPLFMSLIQVWQVKQLDVFNTRQGVLPPQQGYTIN